MSLPLHPTSIGSLPLEIMSHILMLTMPNLSDGETGESRFRFPAVMNQVCRHFRRAVLSTPSLWSFLYLTTSTNESVLAHIRDRINHKSGAVLLDIRLVEFQRNSWNNAAIATINTCSTRWKSLSAALTRYHIWDHPPRPQTTTFHAPSPICFMIPNYPPLSPLLTGSVRSLEMINCGFCWGSSNFTFPPLLETLKIHEAGKDLRLESVVKGLEPLRHSLRSLTLGGFHLTLRSGDSHDHAGCVLEHLQSLNFTGMSVIPVMRLLIHLKAPNLLRLSIEYSKVEISKWNTENDFIAIFQKWKEYTFPRLTCLDLASNSCAHEHIIWVELLRPLTRSIARLLVKNRRDRDAMIHLLRDQQLDGFGSQLKQLTMFGFSAAEITCVIKGRCNALDWLEVLDSDMKLTQGRTKEAFEDNTRDVEYLKTLVDLRVIRDDDSSIDLPRFATWEECLENSAKFYLTQNGPSWLSDDDLPFMSQ